MATFRNFAAAKVRYLIASLTALMAAGQERLDERERRKLMRHLDWTPAGRARR